MFQRCQQQRLAFEITDCFFMQRWVEVGLDHFFDSAWRIAKISILGEVNRSHATSAYAAHKFIAVVQYTAWIQLFDCGLVSAGGSLLSMFDVGLDFVG